MSLKLGQLLIKAGRITTEQLEEALHNQVIHGGRLGTNLVEMGFIKEQELALILGHKLGIPFISSEQIAGITTETVGCINAEIAAKYKVIPIALERKRLSLAMADPSDFAAIDAISFLTGYIIRPVVCPELLLVKLLEKHYGIKRTLRYAASVRPQRPTTQDADPQSDLPPPQDPSSAVTRGSLERGEFPTLENFEGFHRLKGDQFEEQYIGGGYRGTVTLETVAQELAGAQHRDAIAQTLLQFVGIAFPVAALFLVRNNSIVGWKAQVQGELPQLFAHFSIPADEPSLFNTVLATKTFYLGPVPDTSCNHDIIMALAGRAQGASLVLPISISDRIVAFLYLEGDLDPLALRLPELQRLVAKASMAFEILILRNKILMT